MVGLGCKAVLIGHCEERMDKAGVLKEAGCTDAEAVNRILNQEILGSPESWSGGIVLHWRAGRRAGKLAGGAGKAADDRIGRSGFDKSDYRL